jgi:hypothetical protein
MMNQLGNWKHRGPVCLSDLAMDRYRLGELDHSDESDRASAHLGDCEACRARLAALEAVPTPAFDWSAVQVVREPRVGKARRRWPKRVLWLSPVLAAAAVALLVPWGKPDVRNKGGGWQLGVVAQHPNGRVLRVSPGDALAPGDRLRFEVAAPDDAFVSIISLDGKGSVTPFVPANGETAAVRKGPHHLLDGAVRLDDAMGPERIMLLACPRSIPVTDVVAAGRAALGQAQGRLDQLPALDLPCKQTSFWIRKEARP